MRQLNRNAIFGPNIFGSTISYSIVNNDNTLDTRNDLWLQMCFLQRILLLIGKICSCLQKIAKYGKLGLMKNNWLTNLIKTLSKCKRNKVRSVCRKIKYGNVSIVPFFSQQSLSKHLVFTPFWEQHDGCFEWCLFFVLVFLGWNSDQCVFVFFGRSDEEAHRRCRPDRKRGFCHKPPGMLLSWSTMLQCQNVALNVPKDCY